MFGAGGRALARRLRETGANPVIPGRRNPKRTIRHDRQQYRDGYLVDNAYSRRILAPNAPQPQPLTRRIEGTEST
jgi:hypothetical protein